MAKMFTIEVDAEVFEYLKTKAEPFIDTPNSVLRRELLKKESSMQAASSVTSSPKTNHAAGLLPKTPLGTPKALEQILEVAFLVLRCEKTRTDATHYVADKHKIAPQTVLDKYCRQLDLTAYQFDTLLGQSDLRDFKALLKRKFSEHEKLIDNYLDASNT